MLSFCIFGRPGLIPELPVKEEDIRFGRAVIGCVKRVPKFERGARIEVAL